MKKLMSKILIFALPVVIIFSYPFFVMLMAGEFTSVEQITQYQTRYQNPCVILTAYSDPWSYVKLKVVQEHVPEVLILGTSRVMQFRHEFFQTSFYNGSRAVSTLDQLQAFLRKIPKSHNPKILIIGLDQNMFNPNWVFSSTEEMYRKPSRWKEWLRIFAENWSRVYEDELRGKIHIHEIFDSGRRIKRIGLLARAENDGFLNDGSFLYGSYLSLSIPTRARRRSREFRDAVREMKRGEGVYVPGNRVSEKEIAKLEAVLKEASERRIHVVAYLPPFAPTIYKKLLAKKNRYAYLFQLHEKLNPVFTKYGHRIFDFQNPFELHAVDDDFVDDLHDSGSVTRNLFLNMIQIDERLRSVSNSAFRP